MLDSCGISDACDVLGVPAVRTGRLRPMWPDCPALFGRLGTLTLIPDPAADPLPDVLAALARIPAGHVVLVDLGGRTDLQCWGGRTAAVARRAGIVGALVNGAIRDVAHLASLHFPTFAAGTYPARARGRLAYVGSGLDVVIGTEVVRSGSMVVADASGVVFFPADSVSEVFAQSEKIAAAEA
jgi:4-hydroxy-4-methyl-2-oxoglutarate aldolase